jgi:hypothetical protein
MRKLLFSNGLAFLLCLFILPVLAQEPTLEWARLYNVINNMRTDDKPTSMAVDAEGNVYVAGPTTIKYSPSGEQLWIIQFEESTAAIAVDNSGGVYLTGSIDGNYATARYDAATGELTWLQLYDGPGDSNDRPMDIAVDNTGGVYVTGVSFRGDTNDRYATVRYEAATGKHTWSKHYIVSNNDLAKATTIAVDNTDGVYITGVGSSSDYATIRYAAATGEEDWVSHSDGSMPPLEWASALAVDNSGSVYVTGYSLGDYVTVRYHAATGTQSWVSRYSKEKYSEDVATAITVDNAGGVYITGSSTNPIEEDPSHIITVRFDAATGEQNWAHRYAFGEATAIVADNKGGIYVTGYDIEYDFENHSYGYSDYATVRYEATTGKQTWERRYNGPSDRDDQAIAIAVDHAGGVFVTGYSFSPEKGVGFLTVKYSQEVDNVCHHAVSGFTLVNADTNEDLMPLQEGDVLDLNTLPTRHLRIRADTSPDMVGSIIFELDGSVVAVENLLPYRFTATDRLTAGSHTLTATPYCEARGAGAKGTPLTIHFEVVDLAVESFTLVDASTEQDLVPLQDGDVVDLSSLPSRFLSVRANASQTSGIDVVLELSGAKDYTRRELGHPYALFGDEDGSYHAWTPAPGRYTLTATPYSDATGAKGKSLTVSFTVVKGLVTTTASSLRAAGETVATAYPNPTSRGHIQVVLPHPVQGNLQYILVSPLGAEVASGELNLAKGATELELDLSRQMRATGIYYLRLEGQGLQAVVKVVRQ